MENEVVQPNSVETHEDSALSDYRALREGKAPEGKTPAVVPTPKKIEAATPLEPGDPVIDDAEDLDGTSEQQIERKKKLGGYQKKIAKQETELADLRRRLDAQTSGTPAAAPASENGRATPQAAAPAPAIPAFPTPKPTLEDSDGIEDFTEKLNDWKADERDWREEHTTAAAKQADTAKTLVDGWNARKAVFTAEHDDWDDAMDGVKDIKLSPAHQEIFLESEFGPELAYHLATNRNELERIAKLSPLAAAREIGKLETRFAKVDAEDGDAKPEIKVSNAPRPFKPISGANGRATPNIANMDLADYRKAREAGRV